MKKVLLLFCLIFLCFSVYGAEKLWVKSDTLDGRIFYRNGVYSEVNSTTITVGHTGSAGNYNWYRGVLIFDLIGKPKVTSAQLRLSYSSDTVSGETCDFDLNSITDLGSAIDSTDWDSTVFETVDANWFDETLDGNITADITTAWNNAIDNDRNYLAFRIGLDDESSYTDTTDDCYFVFCDTNSTAGDCAKPLSNPVIEYTPATTNNCFLPDDPPTFTEIIACSITFAFISMELASIVFFVILLILMWRLRVPIQASFPLGIGFLIAFSAVFPMDMFVMISFIVVASLFFGAMLKFAKGGTSG